MSAYGFAHSSRIIYMCQPGDVEIHGAVRPCDEIVGLFAQSPKITVPRTHDIVYVSVACSVWRHRGLRGVRASALARDYKHLHGIT